MINNCSNYVTGIGADSQNDSSSSSTCISNRYETLKGQAASTTGNITGVYDMSGGAWEYVMGVLNNSLASSGFSTLPTDKYYNNYINTILTSACNNEICYGHALSETNGWYRDHHDFANSSYPWFLYGDCNRSESSTGVFSFNDDAGGASGNASFRVIIVS